MAARPPTLVRSAFLLSVLVVALAVAPAVEALSALASVRASVKVDPEADPSSLLPTWPTGANDPCVYVVGTIGDVGNVLQQDCKSYICINRVLMNSNGACIVRVNPGTPDLQFRVLWMPESLVDWRIEAEAQEFAQPQTPLECPEWTGTGSAIPPAPLSLPPCDMAPYWNGASKAGLFFYINIGEAAAGTIGVYIGPPDPV